MAPQREGHPLKLTKQTRRALIREATKRSKITLKELQSSTVEIGAVHSTELGFMEECPEKNKQTCLVFAKRHVGDLAIKKNAMTGAKPTPLITPRTPSNSIMLWGCFSSAGTGKLVRIEKIPVSRCAKLIETYPQETCSCNYCKRWLYKVLTLWDE